MHINPNIENPIFIQIAEQLEDSIFTKVFPEETKIPSTNELSSLLNINPHTVLNDEYTPILLSEISQKTSQKTCLSFKPLLDQSYLLKEIE